MEYGRSTGRGKEEQRVGGIDKGEGESKAVICLTEHKNNYDDAIVSPTYICFHFVYPEKLVSLLVFNKNEKKYLTHSQREE